MLLNSRRILQKEASDPQIIIGGGAFAALLPSMK